MEVLDIPMVECLSCSVSKVGVEAKQVFKQIQCVLRSCGEHRCECFFLRNVGAGDDVCGKWRLYGLDILLGRSAD